MRVFNEPKITDKAPSRIIPKSKKGTEMIFLLGLNKNKILHKPNIDRADMNFKIIEIKELVLDMIIFLKLEPTKKGMPERDKKPIKKATYKLNGTDFLSFSLFFE